jgi:PIN domain nuclease of toxin-antitoxin system
MNLPITYPKDPADRIIGATALLLSLLTADGEIRRSRVLGTIWQEEEPELQTEH